MATLIKPGTNNLFVLQLLFAGSSGLLNLAGLLVYHKVAYQRQGRVSNGPVFVTMLIATRTRTMAVSLKRQLAVHAENSAA